MTKSNAERQREFRERQAAKGLKPFYVKGDNGYFDARLRVAAGVQMLANEGKILPDLRAEIIDAALQAMPPRNLIDDQFIRKEIAEFLSGAEENG